MAEVYVAHINNLIGTPWEYTIDDVNQLIPHLNTIFSAFAVQQETLYNKKILIKLNLVRGHKTLSFTTDPRMLEGVLSILSDYNVNRIVVGDNATSDANAADIGKYLGLDQIVGKYNAQFLAFENSKEIRVRHENAVLLKEFHVPEVALTSDFILNLPKLKTHTLTQVSLAIKNHHGFIAKSDRIIFHRDDINDKLLDIYSYFKQKEILHLIDGLWALEGQGPCDQGEQIRDFGCLVAGNDAIAVDAVGATIMGFHPREIPAIRIGDWRGLGIGCLDKITLLGDPLSSVKRDFKRPICAVSGMYKNLTAIEFSSCRGCTCHAMVALDIMSDMGELAYLPENILIILGHAPQNFRPEWREKDIWLVGCATTDAEKYKDCGKVYLIEGCPPWLTDLRQAMKETYHIP